MATNDQNNVMVTKSYEYDYTGKLVSETEYKTDNTASWVSETFRSYDELGNITQSTTNQNDIISTLEYLYDSTGKVIEVLETSQSNVPGNIWKNTVRRTYGDQGELVSETDRNNNIISYSYEYTPEGLLAKTTEDFLKIIAGEEVSFKNIKEYNIYGEIIGLSEKLDYTSHGDNLAEISQYEYLRDLTGLVTTSIETRTTKDVNPPHSPQINHFIRLYDRTGRIQVLYHAESPFNVKVFQYDMDPTGFVFRTYDTEIGFNGDAPDESSFETQLKNLVLNEDIEGIRNIGNLYTVYTADSEITYDSEGLRQSYLDKAHGAEYYYSYTRSSTGLVIDTEVQEKKKDIEDAAEPFVFEDKITEEQYDNFGRVVSQMDEKQHAHTFNYIEDASGNVIRVVETVQYQHKGQDITYQQIIGYNPDGTLNKIVDRNGFETTYHYQNGILTHTIESKTGLYDKIIRYTKDQKILETAWLEAVGGAGIERPIDKFGYVYDETGRISISYETRYERETGEIKSVTHNYFDKRELIETKQEHIWDGQAFQVYETTYEHVRDVWGNIADSVQIKSGPRSSEDPATGSFTASREWLGAPDGNLKSMTDQNGRRFQYMYQYTSRGVLTKSMETEVGLSEPQDPNSATYTLITERVFDIEGNMIYASTPDRFTDIPITVSVDYVYDNRGNVIKRIESETGPTFDTALPDTYTANTEYHMDSLGHIVRTAVPSGEKRLAHYNKFDEIDFEISDYSKLTSTYNSQEQIVRKERMELPDVFESLGLSVAGLSFDEVEANTTITWTYKQHTMVTGNEVFYSLTGFSRQTEGSPPVISDTFINTSIIPVPDGNSLQITFDSSAGIVTIVETSIPTGEVLLDLEIDTSSTFGYKNERDFVADLSQWDINDPNILSTLLAYNEFESIKWDYQHIGFQGDPLGTWLSVRTYTYLPEVGPGYENTIIETMPFGTSVMPGTPFYTVQYNGKTRIAIVRMRDPNSGAETFFAKYLLEPSMKSFVTFEYDFEGNLDEMHDVTFEGGNEVEKIRIPAWKAAIGEIIRTQYKPDFNITEELNNVIIVSAGPSPSNEIVPDFDDLSVALAQSSPGDIIVLLEGTYVFNQLNIPEGVSLIGVDPKNVIIQGLNVVGQYTLTAMGNNLIAGLTVKGGGPLFGTAVDDGTNLIITGRVGTGIHVAGSNVRIVDNIITDNLGYGILVRDVDGTIIENNFIYGNGTEMPGSPVWPYASGIVLDGSLITDKTKIINNTVHDGNIGGSVIQILNGAYPEITQNILETTQEFSYGIFEGDFWRRENVGYYTAGEHNANIHNNSIRIPLAFNGAVYPDFNQDYFGSLNYTADASGYLTVDNDPGIKGASEGSISFTGGPYNGNFTSLAFDGSFRYQADPGFSGVDTFTFRVGDGEEQTVFIKVNYVNPSLSPDIDHIFEVEGTQYRKTWQDGRWWIHAWNTSLDRWEPYDAQDIWENQDEIYPGFDFEGTYYRFDSSRSPDQEAFFEWNGNLRLRIWQDGSFWTAEYKGMDKNGKMKWENLNFGRAGGILTSLGFDDSKPADLLDFFDAPGEINCRDCTV